MLPVIKFLNKQHWIFCLVSASLQVFYIRVKLTDRVWLDTYLIAFWLVNIAILVVIYEMVYLIHSFKTNVISLANNVFLVTNYKK